MERLENALLGDDPKTEAEKRACGCNDAEAVTCEPIESALFR
jgi:hypothetical protein